MIDQDDINEWYREDMGTLIRAIGWTLRVIAVGTIAILVWSLSPF